MNPLLRSVTCGVALIISACGVSVFADDSQPADDNTNRYSFSKSKKALNKARDLIQREQYEDAIQSLTAVVSKDKKNADAWNLLGFSYRKLENFKDSGESYAKALELNPDHKWALEYQGQLFITLNDLENAEKNVQRLKALCPEGCEQLTDLQAAIDAAK